MNNQEAKRILEERLTSYKARRYNELLDLLEEPDTFEISAPSGQEYQVKIQALWDDKPNGALRIIGSIDDGGLRAYSPLSYSFLIYPDTTESIH